VHINRFMQNHSLARISRKYVESHWIPSLGEKLDKIHFREPPPGTRHAECSSNEDYCDVHFDKVNPHQDALGHLIFDSPETLIGLSFGGLAGTTVYLRRRDVAEALLATLVVGFLAYGFVKVIKGLFD